MRQVETHVSKTGVTTYKVRFRRPDAEGITRQTSEPFRVKAQAERFAKWLDALGVEEALDKLYAGTALPDLPTLEQVAQDHFDNLIGVEPGTEQVYRALWKRTWGPRLGHLLIDEVGTDQIGKAFKDLGTKYSLKSLKNQRGLLSGVMNRAIAQGYITKSPVKEIKRLPAGQRSRSQDEMRILTVEEFLTVEAAMSEHYVEMLRFMWATGARWGEVVALQAGDIRWPNVTISRALKYTPRREDVRFGPPKNRKSRTISLPRELEDGIKALVAERKRDELVFQMPKGGLIWHRQWHSKIWTPTVAHLEAPTPTPHDLRHSHASHLLAMGVPIHIVSERLGHSSIKITVDTYGHLQPDAQKWAAQAAQMSFKVAPKELATPSA